MTFHRFIRELMSQDKLPPRIIEKQTNTKNHNWDQPIWSRSHWGQLLIKILKSELTNCWRLCRLSCELITSEVSVFRRLHTFMGFTSRKLTSFSWLRLDINHVVFQVRTEKLSFKIMLRIFSITRAYPQKNLLELYLSWEKGM